MSHTLIWTEEARQDAREIILWISSKFGRRTATEAYERFSENTELLQFMPYRGIVYEHNSNYRVIHLRRSSIYYRIKNETIIITAVFDNRRSDKKIASLLKKRQN